MPIYECKNCDFKTDNNFNYEKHVKTKKHLRNVGKMEDEKTNQKPIKIQPLCNQKPIKMQPAEIILYECEFCDAIFKHTQSKYKHQKYRCKAKKATDENVVLQQRIEYLEKMLDKAMKQINNTTNNNNTVNNDHSRNLNITINAYGNEDLSYLEKGDWIKMLTKPQDSVVKLFLETHFNVEHPENKNIRLRNKKSKFIEVHDGDNWKNKPKKKMLSEIADDKQSILDDKFIKDDDIQMTMSSKQKDAHSEFHDDTYYDNKKRIMEELEATLYDK